MFSNILFTKDSAVKTLLVSQEACPAVTPLYKTAIVSPFIPVDPISNENDACTSPKFKNAS